MALSLTLPLPLPPQGRGRHEPEPHAQQDPRQLSGLAGPPSWAAPHGHPPHRRHTSRSYRARSTGDTGVKHACYRLAGAGGRPLRPRGRVAGGDGWGWCCRLGKIRLGSHAWSRGSERTKRVFFDVRVSFLMYLSHLSVRDPPSRLFPAHERCEMGASRHPQIKHVKAVCTHTATRSNSRDAKATLRVHRSIQLV